MKNIYQTRHDTTKPQDQAQFEILFNAIPARDGTVREFTAISQEIMTFAVEQGPDFGFESDMGVVTLTVRDTASGDTMRFIDALRGMGRYKTGITLKAFDSLSGQTNYTIAYSDVRFVGHEYAFDLFVGGPLHHTVKLTFTGSGLSKTNDPAA